MNAATTSPAMQRALNMIQRMRMSPAERAMADAAMYAKANEAAAYDEGRDERNREIVKNMLKKNYNIDTIADITGFTEDEIKTFLHVQRWGESTESSGVYARRARTVFC